MAFSVLQIHLLDRLGDNITRIVDQYVGRELTHGRVDAMPVGNIQFGPRRSPYFVPLGQEEPLEGLGNAPIATSYKYFHEIQETKLLYCLLEDRKGRNAIARSVPKVNSASEEEKDGLPTLPRSRTAFCTYMQLFFCKDTIFFSIKTFFSFILSKQKTKSTYRREYQTFRKQ